MTSGQQPIPWKKPNRQWLQILISYGIAAGCLYWVFHDVRFDELRQSLAQVNWWWIPLAVLLNLLTYVCVAWEWQFLLRSVGLVSLGRLTQAVFAGRFANDVLPVHIGYVLRVYLASRWLGTNVASVIPSLLVERLFDGFWLALGIGVTALFVPLPAEVLHTAGVLGLVILAGAVVIALLSVRRRKPGFRRSARGFFWGRLAERILSFVGRMVEGIQQIGKSSALGAAIALSLLKMVAQGLAFLAVLWAYGFELSIWVQVAVFLIACVGISLPSTPASAGVFQLFCVAGLTVFGVPKPAASAFSLLAFVVLTVPLSLAGFWALAQSGLKLRQIRDQEVREKLELAL